MSVIDNGSMLLLRYVADWSRFYSEVLEAIYAKLKEQSNNREQKKYIGLERDPKKNFSVYHMQGLSPDEAKKILEANNIKTDFFLQNSKGDVLVAIANEDMSKMLEIQSNLNSGKVTLEEYLKKASYLENIEPINGLDEEDVDDIFNQARVYEAYHQRKLKEELELDDEEDELDISEKASDLEDVLEESENGIEVSDEELELFFGNDFDFDDDDADKKKKSKIKEYVIEETNSTAAEQKQYSDDNGNSTQEVFISDTEAQTENMETGMDVFDTQKDDVPVNTQPIVSDTKPITQNVEDTNTHTEQPEYEFPKQYQEKATSLENSSNSDFSSINDTFIEKEEEMENRKNNTGNKHIPEHPYFDIQETQEDISQNTQYPTSEETSTRNFQNEEPKETIKEEISTQTYTSLKENTPQEIAYENTVKNPNINKEDTYRDSEYSPKEISYENKQEEITQQVENTWEYNSKDNLNRNETYLYEYPKQEDTSEQKAYSAEQDQVSFKENRSIDISGYAGEDNFRKPTEAFSEPGKEYTRYKQNPSESVPKEEYSQTFETGYKTEARKQENLEYKETERKIETFEQRQESVFYQQQEEAFYNRNRIPEEQSVKPYAEYSQNSATGYKNDTQDNSVTYTKNPIDVSRNEQTHQNFHIRKDASEPKPYQNFGDVNQNKPMEQSVSNGYANSTYQNIQTHEAGKDATAPVFQNDTPPKSSVPYEKNNRYDFARATYQNVNNFGTGSQNATVPLAQNNGQPLQTHVKPTLATEIPYHVLSQKGMEQAVYNAARNNTLAQHTSQYGTSWHKGHQDATPYTPSASGYQSNVKPYQRPTDGRHQPMGYSAANGYPNVIHNTVENKTTSPFTDDNTQQKVHVIYEERQRYDLENLKYDRVSDLEAIAQAATASLSQNNIAFPKPVLTTVPNATVPYQILSKTEMEKVMHTAQNGFSHNILMQSTVPYVTSWDKERIYKDHVTFPTMGQPRKTYYSEAEKKRIALELTKQWKENVKKPYSAVMVGDGNTLWNAYYGNDIKFPNRYTSSATSLDYYNSLKADRKDFQLRNNNVSYNELIYGMKKGDGSFPFGEMPDVYQIKNDKNNRYVRINRLELRKMKMTSVSGNIIRQTGEFVVDPGISGVHESEVYQGYRKLDPLLLFLSGFSTQSYSKNYRKAVYKKFQKRLVKDTSYLYELSNFMKKRGYGHLNFMDLKNGDFTIDSFSRMLQNSGLASKRGDQWDYTKFIKLYSSNAAQVLSGNQLGIMIAKKDLQPLIRALGLEYMDSKMAEKIIKEIAVMVGYGKNISDAKKVKKMSWKSFRNLVIKAIMGDNAVVAGFQQIKRIYQTIMASLKAAKVISILLFRAAYHIAKFLAKRIKVKGKTAYEHARTTRVYQGVQRVNEKKAEHRDKKNKKEQEKQNKKQQKRNKKVEKRNARQRKIGKRLEKRFGHMRAYRALVKSMPIAQKILSAINPFKLFGIVGIVKKWLNRLKIAIVVAIAVFLLIVVVLAESLNNMGNAMAAILSFFSGLNIVESVPYMTMTQLQEAERSWKSSLENEDTYSNFNSMRFGDNYVSADEYASANGMTFDASQNAFIFASPFGFETPYDSRKPVSKVDAGIEVKFENSQDDKTNTSNIKDILSMAQTFYDHNDKYDKYYLGGTGVLNSSVKKSGLSDSVINVNVRNEDTLHGDSYKAFLQYCIELFNISHQESVSVYPVVLLTKTNYPEDAEIDEDLLCPSNKYKGYGCTEYEHFLYQNNKISIRDVNGAIHEVDTLVHPAHTYDNCNATDIETFKEALAYNPDCYKIESEIYYSEWETIKEWSEADLPTIDDVPFPDEETEAEKTEEVAGASLTDEDLMVMSLDDARALWGPDFERTIKDLCNSYGLAYEEKDLNIIRLADGRFKVETRKKIETEERSEYLPDKKVTWYQIQEREIIDALIFDNVCAENHSGTYCGGHLKAEVTGYIYTMTTEQENGDYVDKTGGVVPEKVSETTLATSANIMSMKDIFDCDGMLRHETQLDNWKGWDKSNVELAVLKKIQDWEDLYDITINNMLGGETLSRDEINDILASIEDSYMSLYGEPLPERRREVVTKALQLVGNLGYSDPDPNASTFGHHACPFEGPCVVNPSVTCYMSDCSGFASHLWMPELGRVCNTTDFVNLNHQKVYELGKNPKPGDILTLYNDTTKHSVIYIGDILVDFLTGTQTYIVDCNDLGSQGATVFFRAVDFVPDCYYYNPLHD